MRSKSSHQWLKEHFADEYVKRAQKEGWRCRAAYKLLEIQERDQLFKPGMQIVDLGAAPGGWTQVLSKIMKGKGRIVALDLLEMDAFEDVAFIQGDFTDNDVYAQLLEVVGGEKIDWVLSDMAPNMSGTRAVDQPRCMALAEMTLEFCEQVLKPGGGLLIKVFHGEGFDQWFKSLREHFTQVATRKPKASRPRSRECYVLARGYR